MSGYRPVVIPGADVHIMDSSNRIGKINSMYTSCTGNYSYRYIVELAGGQRIKCQNCDFTDEKTVHIDAGKTVRDIPLGACPKCTAPLILEEEIDIVDELTKLAEQSSAKVELISDDFEEGSILFSAFGGIAAILRYRTGC